MTSTAVRNTIGGAVLALAVLASCGSEDDAAPGDASGVEGVEVPDGFVVEEVVTGLDRPSQIALAPDGRLLVAQLAGGERDGTGQVVTVDLDVERRGDDPVDGPHDVLLDDLVVPTGVAVFDDELWVMEQRTLSRGPLDGGDREIVTDDLPFNGRSEGTLTTTPDGRLLWNTSGDREGDAAADGSGRLFAIDAAGGAESIASGLKHAYAHVVGPDGTLWVTEIGDGTYDGAPPPDELVAVTDGDDFGWPRCIGDRTPVAEYGGTAARCASTPRSHALFPPRSTPTSVAIAPWDDEVLLVALWVDGAVVAVPVAPGDEPHDGEPFLTGIEHPQHLLADGDRLLVVDHDGGRVLAVRRV